VNELAAYRFALTLRTLAEPGRCADLFRAAIAPLGYDTFACGEFDASDRNRAVFHLIDWPERWRAFYMSSGLIHRDPVVEAVAERDTPLTWGDLRADRSFAAVGGEALERIVAHGWTKGYCVPIIQGGNRRGIVSLVGCGAEPGEAERAFLYLISTALHQHVRSLVPTKGFAVPPIGLTDRELAAVRLVARGAPDKEIAQALAIAPSTAHEFVEKAKAKLGARSRAELAFLAAQLAIVSL
jgi:LuxR family quorum-sensing system transcriptional regulator CciR